MYDVIVIGAGPAGISASIYARRANLNVLVLYYGESQLEKAPKIENYYGFTNGITGSELYNNGINQAKNLGVDVLKEQVTNIKITEDMMFKIETPKNEYSGKSIIIATGNSKIKPNIKGIQEFEGKGISYCAICDGFFYRGKNIAIIGDGEFALSEANDLKNLANSITILTNGMNSNLKTDYQIINKKIKEIKGNNTVNSVLFEDDSSIDVEGVFIAQGIAEGNDFAKMLGVITEGKNIKVNEDMSTNVKGIFACGNLTGGLLQINKATYEGAKAGLSATKYCKGE